VPAWPPQGDFDARAIRHVLALNLRIPPAHQDDRNWWFGPTASEPWCVIRVEDGPPPVVRVLAMPSQSQRKSVLEIPVSSIAELPGVLEEIERAVEGWCWCPDGLRPS
jgi:hypothetical protein